MFNCEICGALRDPRTGRLPCVHFAPPRDDIGGEHIFVPQKHLISHGSFRRTMIEIITKAQKLGLQGKTITNIRVDPNTSFQGGYELIIEWRKDEVKNV